MSNLVLHTWKENPVVTDPTDPDIATVVRYGERVFIYGKAKSVGTDATNMGVVLKAFGQASIYRKNLLAVNHTVGIDQKGRSRGETLNGQRLDEISTMNDYFANFFLEQLHFLTWKDYDKGVQSTIKLKDAFKMLTITTRALYDLLLASVDDKFSKDLSMSEMQNVIDIHNLNNQYTLGMK